ncbi:MAG TPA: TonB-dependent receptor [Steroidobacteraceae bacterium]|nr:TonB-dependent receptor [Steroidobacteraceae bacterium]
MNRITLAVKSALGLALLVPPAMVFAQAANSDSSALEEVVVTGIRASVEQSLVAKRNADSVQEVISAEDIGKMPDKNVADSLTRVPGVTTSSASANEGGFDENDRVSMRGTNPSLTQTLINGHAVGAGDWFVLNQVQQVGRSVSYTLLPSELVSQVVVHKSSQASLVEGGVAGSVDILTRKPLDFNEPLTLQGSVGLVYADMPDKKDGQYSILGNWKNDANNFGVMVQGFYEARHLRRDGLEVLGYETIAAGSAVATSNPDLAGVKYPALIGAAFFEQERKRKGGLIDFQWAPTDDLSFDLQGFASKLDAANYNRNYLTWQTHFMAGGGGQAPLPGYVVTNNTLVSASFAAVPGTLYGVYDQISRPDESGSSNFVTLESNWHANEALSFLGQIGTSVGHGKTGTQDVSETQPGTGDGVSWQLNGTGRGPDFAFGNNFDDSTPLPGGQPITFGWIFGAQNVDVKDEEEWAKIDSTYAIDNDSWTDLKFGVRYQTHERSSFNAIAQGPTGGSNVATYPNGFTNYPNDFHSFGGNIPTDVWYWTPAQLAAYNGPTQVNRDLLQREYYQYAYDVKEKNSAAYVQADFKGDKWSANVGVRWVQTKEHAVTFTQTAANTPGATTTSLFGPFIGIGVDHTYNDVLPSANLKFDLAPDLVARFAASRTMTRADYSALGGFTDLSPPGTPGGTGTGSGGNPDLKPIRSTNLDAGVEWYFAPRSLLSVGLFYMDLDNYIGYGSETKSYLTFSSQVPNGEQVPYLLTVPVNAKGRVQGAELAYQQALGQYFGVQGSYTYADGKQTSLVTNGDDRLVGTSKNTYSASGYFENQKFSARVSYTYRSAFFSGLDRNSAFSQDEIGSLAASLQYALNDTISFSLDGQNLNDPTLKYYAANKDQPRAFYKNGAQYYFTVRAKF